MVSGVRECTGLGLTLRGARSRTLWAAEHKLGASVQYHNTSQHLELRRPWPFNPGILLVEPGW